MEKQMRKIGNILSSLFLIAVFAASITFSYFNTAPISVAFGSLQFPAQPVSVWIIGAFVLGGSIGLLLGLGIFRRLKYKANIRRLNKQLAEAKQEISQLKAMSLKGLQ